MKASDHEWFWSAVSGSTTTLTASQMKAWFAGGYWLRRIGFTPKVSTLLMAKTGTILLP
jgi:hypothetical protein